MNQTTEHLATAIASAPLRTDPFNYYITDDAFSEEQFGAMIGKLPPSSAYDPLYHSHSIVNGKATRFEMTLDAAHLDKLADDQRAFWSDIAATMNDAAVTAAIFAKLNVPPIAVNAKVILVRDTQGYVIHPHPDIAAKYVTTQYYLTPNDERPQLGTEMYRKIGDKFEVVETVPFKRRHGYGFGVTPHSWHGVKRHDLSGGVRDSLMVIYFRA